MGGFRTLTDASPGQGFPHREGDVLDAVVGLGAAGPAELAEGGVGRLERRSSA